MDERKLIIGIMLLSQTTVGILGNFSLLPHYLVLYNRDNSQRGTDMILKHLIVANCLIILFKGVPHAMSILGLKEFFNDMVCRFLLYMYRVGRSMSILSTCLLSVFQAITISPRSSCWKDLKVKVPKYIGLFIPLCWTLYMVINLILPIYIVTVKLNIKNMTDKIEYCSTGGWDGIIHSLYTALLVSPEVLFSVLILWSSGSMVATLYRHKKRVQHIHSTNVSSRASPESRATQTILALVSTFVTFYTLSSILNACIAILNNPSQWLVNITSIISISFSCFLPFVLMSNDSAVSRLCFVQLRNKKSRAGEMA